MKELYIKAHEELIADYLESNPSATEQQAYDATADLAHGRMTEALADRIDHARQLRKEGLL